MKKLPFFFFMLAAFALFSQSPYYLQDVGGNDVDENLGMANDHNGNMISVGYFTNTIYFPNNTTLGNYGNGTNDILIQKTNSIGQKVWAVKAGGLGSDRATAVTCDAAGNSYVTGYYYGSAQFGSITLNSVSSTQDIFIAKLDASGNFMWAKSAGGNLSETPNAITLDNNGNVIITGQFEGAATFGTQTITSMLNTSGSSSFDIFVAKYDNSGSFLWLRQGSAKYDDRGIDVGTDASGNIFVCGQFSDTITFSQVHNNQVANAVFLIKYNASGQEQWFRKAGTTNSIAYGLAVNAANEVYMTGDYTGNLIFYGTPNNILYGAYTNRIFLVKYSNSGNYMWGREDASNSYVSAKDVALDGNDDPCIFGEFDCKMDEYSVLAGGTGMFNSVGFHDLFITQYDKNGNRQWARNFGGPRQDKAHGIVFNGGSTPYVCGSFEKSLNITSTYTTSLYGFPINNNWISSANCNNNNYDYYFLGCAGFSDGFIIHSVDNTSPMIIIYGREQAAR